VAPEGGARFPQKKQGKATRAREKILSKQRKGRGSTFKICPEAEIETAFGKGTQERIHHKHWEEKREGKGDDVGGSI